MSFAKAMKLKGFVELQQDSSLCFHGQLYDGHAFKVINLSQWEVQMYEDPKPSKTRVQGFLYVTNEGQQGDVVYLTLPKPSTNHGKQIIVKEIDLMPRDVTIENFNPTKREVPEKKDE